MDQTVAKIDLKNYKQQGNLGIDMVVACLLHYRGQGIEPKAIVLNPKYYGLLMEWVADNYPKDHEHAEFYLDCVAIRCERIYSGKILHVEFWPTPKAEA